VGLTVSTEQTQSDHDVACGDCPAPNATPEEKGQYVHARYHALDDHYLGFYQSWAKTILFLFGKQWLTWLAKTRRYTPATDVPPWRQQPVTNITYAVYRTLAAKLTKSKPTLEVVPPSGDSDDKEAARIGQALLVHLWRLLKKPAKVRRGIGWFLATGQVYLRIHWDPKAGKLVPLSDVVEVDNPDTPGETMERERPLNAEGKPYTKPDGSDDFDAKPALVPEGEVAFDVVDPLSVRFDPEATDAEDATEMFVARPWTRKRAAQHFNIPESELEASSGDGDRETYDDLLASAAAGMGLAAAGSAQHDALGASKAEALGARVLVIEYYRKPDEDRPEGAHWVTIGKRQVWPKQGEAPLPNGFWPPVIPVLSLPIPGMPQAMGVLPQVVPLNEQLNTLDGKIMEHEVTMTMGGKWIVHPDDKGLRITSDPAQVLASKGYMSDKPPIQARMVPLPAEVYAERAVIMDKIRLITSMSEAEFGKKPEGVSAGRAFLVLQEVTDSVLGPDLQAWEEALEEAGRRELVLAQRHYREERTMAIRGERGKWEVRSFSGADLTDGLDVRVQVGSSFPWSKAAQWDTKLNVLTAFPGLVTNAQTGEVDQERLSTFLDTSGTGLQSFESDEDPDLVEVQREHDMFAALDQSRGEQQVPQIGFWMNHPKHLEAHFNFLKRDYGRFLRWTPEAQKAFLAHVQQTMQAVDELAQQVRDATAPPPSAPGAPGAPGEPAPDDESAPGAASDAAPDVAPARNPNEAPALSAGDLASATPQPALAGA
jgi:hypothetical protein